MDVDEEFVARGAEAYSGTLHGKVAFDRTKSVPRTVAVETRTRIDRMGQYTLVSHHFDFALKEDSFSKK
ncbi:MAG: hypothetical protein GIW95_02195 [Candidatus Eremiobacteraeota bacterium]|nr:hypothetical protein [Candidatus Eremiobacteraeota bacterium]